MLTPTRANHDLPARLALGGAVASRSGTKATKIAKITKVLVVFVFFVALVPERAREPRAGA